MRHGIVSLSAALMLIFGAAARAHDHGESRFGQGVAANAFTLEEAAIQNLGIRTTTANLHLVQDSTKMLMQIKLLPERQAVITPRFQGKVMDVKVKLGEKIGRGQPLVTLQPVSIGNSPVTLESPIDGELSHQIAVIGQIVNPGDILMEVSDRTQVLAKGITYESAALGAIRNGQRVNVTVNSLPGKSFSGTVQRIDPSIDADERTFSVFALLDNPEKALIPHMQGQMEIFTGEGERLLTIPAQAILGTLGQNFVYVRDGNHFERRDVTLGVSRGSDKEIIRGVLPGDEVVIQGNYQLQYVTPASENAGEAGAKDHEHAH